MLMNKLSDKVRIWTLSLFILLLCGATSYTQEIPAALKHSHLSKAMRGAKSSKKLVFAYVYTSWSIPSMKMLDSTFIHPTVINTLEEHYEPVAVNASRKKKFVQEYDIHVYPTTLVMDWKGNVIIRSTGQKTPADLLAFLDRTKSNSRFLRQSIDTILYRTNKQNILETIDSVKLYKDDYTAMNLAKKYLDRKDTDWRDLESMTLIKDHFHLDKDYLKFISKYHFKFFEVFDSISIKENIAFHVFLNSLKTDHRGRAKFDYKPVEKWFRKHRIKDVDKLENFVKIKYLLWGRGPSVSYSVKLLKDYPETTDENVLYASAIRLLISNSRRKIDYRELIRSVKSTIKEDGTFWRYDLLSLLYYKKGDIDKSNEAIQSAQSIAISTGQEYNPTLPYLKDIIDSY